MENKSFITPFWLMVILLLLYVGSLYHSYQLFTARPGVSTSLNRWLLTGAVSTIIITAESIVYLIFRKRLHKKGWVRTHIYLMYFALIILPGLHIFIASFMGSSLGLKEYALMLPTIIKSRFLLYCFSLLIGHIFFFLAINDAYKNKSVTLQDEQPQELLGEFISGKN